MNIYQDISLGFLLPHRVMYGPVCVYLKGRWIWVLDFQVYQDGLFKGLGGKGEVHTIQSSFSSNNNTSSDLLKATQIVFGNIMGSEA